MLGNSASPPSVAGRKRSVWIEVEGGLANQLFAWAGGRILHAQGWDDSCSILLDSRKAERDLGAPFVLPNLGLTHQVLGMSGLEGQLWRWGRLVLGIEGIRKVSANVSPFAPSSTAVKVGSYDDLFRELHSSESDIWVRSYLQSADVLSPYRQELGPMVYSAVAQFMKSQTSSSVTSDLMQANWTAVHVRRGDYLTERNVDLLGVCRLGYYVRAVREITGAGHRVLIVTDDPVWCGRELAPALEDRNYRVSIQSCSAMEDLWSLMNADGLVLSNSTFSWWAAFAGKASRIVGPDPWFNSRGGGNLLQVAEWKYVSRDEELGV